MARKVEPAPAPAAAPAAEPATREELIALAESMNNVLSLDPPITITKKMTEEQIENLIIEQAEGNIYEIDFTPDAEDATVPFFSDADREIIELLEIAVQPGAPPEEGAEAPEPAPATKPTKGAKAAAPAPAAKPAAAKGKAAAPAPAPAPAATGRRGAAAAPAAKPAKPAAESYTRSNALADALEKGGTKAEIVANADAYYIEENKGATSNPVVSEAMYRYAVPTMLILGYAKKDAAGKVTLVKIK